MGRRNRREQQPQGSTPPAAFEVERTLAAAEEDEGFSSAPADPSADVKCQCGSSEFLLEAYLHVVDGRPRPDPVEVETLSCPQCGREYEAVQTEDGRVLRGEFLGNVELED